MSLPSWCPKYDPVKRDAKTGEEIYCICKKPDLGELMIGCDGCDDWYHFSCMRIPDEYRDLVFSFYCPYCTAGITGPALENGGILPRTLWKRKCRLPGCFKECAHEGNSKYCCSDHGKEYMQRVVDKLYLPGVEKMALLRQLLQQTDSLDEFKTLGHGELPEVTAPLSKELYNNLLNSDENLSVLSQEYNELDGMKQSTIMDQMSELERYTAWIGEVNKQLFGNEKDGAAKKKGKVQRKVAICGYRKSYEIPCSIEEFIEKYSKSKEQGQDTQVILGVCCKIRCIKHQDWNQLRQNDLEIRRDSLRNAMKRLELLMKIRTNQLGTQFFEQNTLNTNQPSISSVSRC